MQERGTSRQLMGSNGPVVIDWFDATIGHPVADVVRSAILMQPIDPGEPRHLPGATSALLEQLRRAYLAEFHAELSQCVDDLACWQGVIAAGRMAEGAEPDERGLVALWVERANDATARALLLE